MGYSPSTFGVTCDLKPCFVFLNFETVVKGSIKFLYGNCQWALDTKWAQHKRSISSKPNISDYNMWVKDFTLQSLKKGFLMKQVFMCKIISQRTTPDTKYKQLFLWLSYKSVWNLQHFYIYFLVLTSCTKLNYKIRNLYTWILSKI